MRAARKGGFFGVKAGNPWVIYESNQSIDYLKVGAKFGISL